MNDNRSETDLMLVAITKAIDKQAKRRPIDAVKVCAALGAADAAVAAITVPEHEGAADAVMLSALNLGFTTVLGDVRRARAGATRCST